MVLLEQLFRAHKIRPATTIWTCRPGPLEELRAAVEDAASELRDGKPAVGRGRRSSGPKEAGVGDYSTNAAMLLAPSLGAKPRDIAEQLGGRAVRARSASASSGSRWPAPASSTSSSPRTGS